ncbi:hypothetical protein RBG11_004256 [Vibrio parahaemolyticus]|nr:hypothetical protein [Vibrio parahaemolyticus]
MADFYRISNFVTWDDLFSKIRTAFTDIGYTVTGVNANCNVNVNSATTNDTVYMYVDENYHMRFRVEGDGGEPPFANQIDEIMRLYGSITEIHLIGWETPKALLVAFRRTDEVWVMFYLGDLDNIGGNPQGYIFSHSNQYQDGEMIGSVNPSAFPFGVYHTTDVQRPLFSHLTGNYREAWGTMVSFDAGQGTTYDWLTSTTGDHEAAFMIPLTISNYAFQWGCNLGWKKLQAVNPNYDFPSQLLPIEIFYFYNKSYFYPMGNVAHVRATKRNGINALDRIVIGNEEYLMLPWSRVGVRANGIGSENYLFAFKLTATQITPVSI